MQQLAPQPKAEHMQKPQRVPLRARQRRQRRLRRRKKRRLEREKKRTLRKKPHGKLHSPALVRKRLPERLRLEHVQRSLRQPEPRRSERRRRRLPGRLPKRLRKPNAPRRKLKSSNARSRKQPGRLPRGGGRLPKLKLQRKLGHEQRRKRRPKLLKQRKPQLTRNPKLRNPTTVTPNILHHRVNLMRKRRTSAQSHRPAMVLNQ
mmetsp:Transcript_16714/g.36963  ORF Transcript_16714/g.36963 Transcript_16714/m.36963 type:complete len:204 (+) Transcript_16714:416-1027(+)